jgi:predicted Zn-dependent peptidase
VASLELEDLIRFYRRLFMPNRSILLLASPMGGGNLRGFVTRYFGLWTKKEAPEYNFAEPANSPSSPQGSWKKGGTGTSCCVASGAKTLPLKHDDTPALQILRRVLEKRLQVPAASGQTDREYMVDLQGFFQQGHLVITARGPVASAGEMTEAIHQSVQDLIKGGCSPAEFLAARNDLLEDFQRSIADPSRRNLTLLLAEFYRLGTRYLDIYSDQLEATIREDISYLADKYLSGMSTVIVSSEKPDFTGVPFTIEDPAGDNAK